MSMSKMMLFQSSEDELSASECHERQIWPNAHLWLAAGARSNKGVPVKLPLVVPRQALLKTLHDAVDSHGVVLAAPWEMMLKDDRTEIVCQVAAANLNSNGIGEKYLCGPVSVALMRAQLKLMAANYRKNHPALRLAQRHSPHKSFKRKLSNVGRARKCTCTFEHGDGPICQGCHTTE